MRGLVRTVLGDVDPASLGSLDYHEHLFHASPLLPGEDLVDEEASTAECLSFLASGFGGLIDATPLGLGRRPEALGRIAARTGATIVASTGRHRDAHYADGVYDDLDLEALFLRELTDGIAASDSQPEGARAVAPDGALMRAGQVKVGIDYWRISPAERRAITAAGAAHRATGAPVMVHTERASAVFELLDELAKEGVAASRVAIAHADRNPDPGLHAEIAATGAYLGYDGAARLRDWPESVLLDCLEKVVSAGHGDRVLIGGDVARASSWSALGGLPGLAYLGRRYVPRVRDVIGSVATNRLLVTNPARYLTWSTA
ncbi:phosphotriesterase family protein [Leifsonia sp. AG29]|uniref:phosphotriesterase family protein n=1 Tax=Leifsonia sp. AG29 TaxID=2598860 RepID=UPI00131D73BC|nr:aryldialkylphosphatase [Leifsonia sp. AG29]